MHQESPPAPNSLCPRCGNAFACGAHRTAPCACTQIRLTPDQHQALQARYHGCLCLACLRALASASGEAEAVPGAAPHRP